MEEKDKVQVQDEKLVPFQRGEVPISGHIVYGKQPKLNPVSTGEDREEPSSETAETASRSDGTSFNFAQHALFMADAVVFLVERIEPFKNSEVRISRDSNKRIFLELGKNVMALTKQIVRELERHKTFYLYALPAGEYAPDSMPVGFVITDEAWSKIEEWAKEMEE